MLQRERRQLLCCRSDKLWGGVWTALQTRGVFKNQQVYGLAGSNSAERSSCCTQAAQKADHGYALSCPGAALKCPLATSH